MFLLFVDIMCTKMFEMRSKTKFYLAEEILQTGMT